MYILDGAMMTSQAGAHDHIQEALGFPSYYGRNLDALYDCLTDMKGEICMYHVSLLRRSLNVYAEKILRVFSDAQSDLLKIRFVD